MRLCQHRKDSRRRRKARPGSPPRTFAHQCRSLRQPHQGIIQTNKTKRESWGRGRGGLGGRERERRRILIFEQTTHVCVKGQHKKAPLVCGIACVVAWPALSCSHVCNTWCVHARSRSLSGKKKKLHTHTHTPLSLFVQQFSKHWDRDSGVLHGCMKFGNKVILSVIKIVPSLHRCFKTQQVGQSGKGLGIRTEFKLV